MSKFYGYANKSAKMSDWIRLTCKDPKFGLLVSDLDFIFFDYKLNRMKLVEVKTYNKKIKDWQKNLFTKIHNAVLRDNQKKYSYDGFFLVTLSQEFPDESETIKINDKIVSVDDLISFLNFELEFDDL